MINKARKHAITILTAMLFSIASASAQSLVSTGKRTPEERAGMQTEWMKSHLILSPVQQQQVEALNLKYARKNDPILLSTSGKLKKFRQLKALQHEKDTELKTILDQAQYKKYQELRDQMTETLKARRHANQN